MKRLLILLTSAMLIAPAAFARPSFDVCWSIYVGWMPWEYGDTSGIVQAWGDRYDIDINVVQINDYIESINQYTSGQFDGCTMTNMDALTIPAASFVDSTALIVGDFSDGNDGVVLKGADQLANIAGQRVNLVELSVSHYLLARALESVGLTERDITVVNTSDADLVAAFTTPNVTAVTTWNPLLGEIRGMPSANVVFDSSQIPGEIIDLMVVKTDVLAEYPELGMALTGAWYEIMSKMRGEDAQAVAVRTQLAEASGTDLAGFDMQLASTRMFFDAADAVAFTNSPELLTTMANVAAFSFEHGLLGSGAPTPEFIGVETPAGVFGDPNNIQLRFDPRWMQMAADGEL